MLVYVLNNDDITWLIWFYDNDVDVKGGGSSDDNDQDEYWRIVLNC
jgi:hypothetical protein